MYILGPDLAIIGKDDLRGIHSRMYETYTAGGIAPEIALYEVIVFGCVFNSRYRRFNKLKDRRRGPGGGEDFTRRDILKGIYYDVYRAYVIMGIIPELAYRSVYLMAQEIGGESLYLPGIKYAVKSARARTAKMMYKAGMSKDGIAEAFGCSRSCVESIINKGRKPDNASQGR